MEWGGAEWDATGLHFFLPFSLVFLLILGFSFIWAGRDGMEQGRGTRRLKSSYSEWFVVLRVRAGTATTATAAPHTNSPGRKEVSGVS